MRIPPVIRDLRKPSQRGRGPNRLLYVPRSPRSIDYESLATSIQEQDDGTVYVIDSSFIARHEIPRSVIDALRRFEVVIPHLVGKEFDSLRAEQKYNADFIATVKSSSSAGDSWLLRDDASTWDFGWLTARSYYATLLLYRKQRAVDLVDRLRYEIGKEPTKDDLDQLWNKIGGRRDFRFLRKGHKDWGKPNYAADEDAVVLAAMIAFVGGKNVVLLTRDGDLLDQHQKLFSRLVQHYQSHLFAQWYADEPQAFETRGMPVGLFELDRLMFPHDSFLVRKPTPDPSDLIHQILPSDYRQVTSTCVLLSGPPEQMSVSTLMAIGETGLSKLFWTKGITGGLCTDRLSGRDCHVWGYKACISDPRNWVAITRDRIARIEHGNALKISWTDLVCIGSHNEVVLSVS